LTVLTTSRSNDRIVSASVVLSDRVEYVRTDEFGRSGHHNALRAGTIAARHEEPIAAPETAPKGQPAYRLPSRSFLPPISSSGDAKPCEWLDRGVSSAREGHFDSEYPNPGDVIPISECHARGPEKARFHGPKSIFPGSILASWGEQWRHPTTHR
jgi:hypothetical protein